MLKLLGGVTPPTPPSFAPLAIEMPKFDVSQRSIRERFQFLFERRKARNREEERASGISPDISDIDKLLDELIELFQTANLERGNSAKTSADRAALDAERGLDMRRMSMETMGESSKRQASGTDRGREKRSRWVHKDTFEYLNEKLTLDIEWQRKDLELKERVLEVKVKSREYKEKERDRYREHVERRFDSICNHLEKQNEVLLQMSRHLEEQRTLLLTVFGTSEEQN